MPDLLSVPVKPDWEGLVKAIRREGTPDRVYNIELFLDGEVQQAIAKRFDLDRDLSPQDPFYIHKSYIKPQRFLGYDFVRIGVDGSPLATNTMFATDCAGLARDGGRTWMAERGGPIQNWEDFEKYPWPKRENLSAATLEWYKLEKYGVKNRKSRPAG